MKDAFGRLRWRNVLIGAVVQAAIAIPALIVGSAVNGGDESNAAVVALVLVLFVAPFVGGVIAAMDERSMPYVHGAVAAGLGWLAVVLHAVGRLVFGNGSPNAATLVVTGIVNVSIGMLGGYFSFRRALRKEDSDQSPRR